MIAFAPPEDPEDFDELDDVETPVFVALAIGAILGLIAAGLFGPPSS